MKTRETTTTVVIHHSASSPDTSVETIRDWHTKGNGWADIGYHYFLEPYGIEKKGRPDSVVGAHVAWHNHDSIGICLAGNFDIEEPTKEQKVMLLRLIRRLQEK